MKVVLIDWVDSASTGGDRWQSKDDVIVAAKEDGATTCWSVGYVVYEDDRQVVITSSHNGKHGMVMDPTIIPRCAITAMREVDVTAGETTIRAA